MLKKEREEILLEIDNYNRLMIPRNFLENKRNIERKYEYYENIENLNFEKELLNLQKQIIKCMYSEIEKTEEKEQIIDLIYKYRYYNYLPVNDETNIYQIKELKRYLNKLVKELIDKAIKQKAINQITKENDKEIDIIERLFLSKIIELEHINMKLTKKNEKFYITIFDEEIEDGKIELKNIEKQDFKIKLNKKTKLFI